MTSATQRSALITAVVCSLSCVPALAADEASDWLARINRAARTLNYDGTFVYRRGDQIDTLRVVHKVSNGAVRERLVSLSGTPREVVRSDNEIRSYVPDLKSVVVQWRSSAPKNFPSILPEQVSDLALSYSIEMGPAGRIVGLTAQSILIKPRDDYRYGYRLWADRESGLLIKAELVNDQGSVIEQFMFTDIAIGGNIPESALVPQLAIDGAVVYRESRAQPETAKQKWRALRLPKGFRLSMSMTHKHSKLHTADHLVYTDGLATVSVFIDKPEQGVPQSAGGSRQVGALVVMDRPVDSHHVTVVGEVPAKTIALIGGSIAPALP